MPGFDQQDEKMQSDMEAHFVQCSIVNIA